MIIKTILVYILLIIATTKPVASCNENKVINSKKVANNKNYEITILYPHYLQIYSESEKFVKKYGVKKFLYEIYNILGTRKKACITNNNIALAEALGINIKPQELPANIDKSRIWEKISKSHNQVVFSHIADIFANTNRLKSISKTQKLFLEWNFRSTANYQYVLKKESGDIVSIDGAKEYKI